MVTVRRRKKTKTSVRRRRKVRGEDDPKEWVVSLKYAPTIVVNASNKSEAIDEWKKICSINGSDHKFNARRIKQGERFKTDKNGVVLSRLPAIPEGGHHGEH